MAGRLRAGVLATAVVVSVLLLLLLAGVMWLWEADFLLFSRTNYLRIQLANIESTFTLYRTDPSIAQDSIYQLYDSLPASRMRITATPWGLYELVSVASPDGRVHATRLMAAAAPGKETGTFWYRDNKSSLTLSGRTDITGAAFMPRNGVVYGQMQSVFFSGEKLPPANIKRSGEQFPQPTAEARGIVEALFKTTGTELATDSLHTDFYRTPTTIVRLGSGTLAECSLTGNIILLGERLHFDASCRLRDIVVVARTVSFGEGFRGRLQVFASDSVTVGKHAVLDFPSGVYAGRYAETGDGSRVNGYLVVDPAGVEADVKKPNLRKSRTSRLRGLLWVDGIAALQGIVTGAAVVGESVYYSPQGYYRHMLYEASVLECGGVHYPLWLDTSPGRKEAAWVE